MDPLSQAVVGATFSAGFCRKREWIKPALVAGVVGGVLPDIDVLIRSSADPLLAIEYHRHFTHALAFAPVGGLVAALLCWRALRRHLSFAWIYIFATLGYATHGPLDALTNYGTHLFWPLTERRESWNMISIIDPIFTLTLLALCIAAYRKSSRACIWSAAAFACFYWSVGYLQRETATEAMYALAASRGHQIEHFEVKPSFANIIVWRTQYASEGHYYIDAVRLGTLRKPQWYYGGSVPAFDVNAWSKTQDKNSPQYNDVMRFAFFSDGWLATLPADPTIIADMRFAMLPNSTAPLWGIKLAGPDQHTRFVQLRQERFGAFPALWRMIRGE